MKNISKKIKNNIFNVIIWLIVFLVNFPLIWMLSSSFKQRDEVYAYPPIIFSKDPTISNFIELFRLTNFERYFVNSIIVAVCTTLITILIATLAAYSLSRFKIKGSRIISKLYIIIYLVPRVVLLIPIFLIMKNFNLTDNLFGVVITYTVLAFPYCYLMLRSYMGSISKSMEESAMVEGATRFGAFIRVVLPVAIPGIIATSIFAVIICWNEFLFALVLLTSDTNKTLTIGVSSLLDQYAVRSWGVLMAAGVVVTIPMIIYFIIVQRRMVIGLTAGAIKE